MLKLFSRWWPFVTKAEHRVLQSRCDDQVRRLVENETRVLLQSQVHEETLAEVGEEVKRLGRHNRLLTKALKHEKAKP